MKKLLPSAILHRQLSILHSPLKFEEFKCIGTIEQAPRFNNAYGKQIIYK
jgi:hypothetical protein